MRKTVARGLAVVVTVFTLGGCSDDTGDAGASGDPSVTRELPPGQVSVTSGTVRRGPDGRALVSMTLTSGTDDTLTGVLLSTSDDRVAAGLFAGFADPTQPAAPSAPSEATVPAVPLPEPTGPTEELALPAGQPVRVGPGGGPGVAADGLRLRGKRTVTAVLEFRDGPDVTLELPVTR